MVGRTAVRSRGMARHKTKDLPMAEKEGSAMARTKQTKIISRPHISDYCDPTICDSCGHKIGYAKSVKIGKKIVHDFRPNYLIGECSKAY